MSPQVAQAKELADPVQMMLEVQQLRGEQASLAQQLNTAISNMGGSLQALQVDVRDFREGQTQIVNELAKLRENSSGLERLAQAIKESTEESMRWRRDHEKEDQKVAGQVSTWRGMVIGFGAAVSLLVALGAFYINGEFNRLSQENASLRSDLKDVQRKLGIVP